MEHRHLRLRYAATHAIQTQPVSPMVERSFITQAPLTPALAVLQRAGLAMLSSKTARTANYSESRKRHFPELRGIEIPMPAPTLSIFLEALLLIRRSMHHGTTMESFARVAIVLRSTILAPF